MQYDEDENPGHVLTPDSQVMKRQISAICCVSASRLLLTSNFCFPLVPPQNSSVEGIFPQPKSHPFRIIETDAMSVQSMVSLGKVGRILAGSIDPSEISGKEVHQPQQQPQSQLRTATSIGTISSSSSSTATASSNKDPGSSSTLHHQHSLSQPLVAAQSMQPRNATESTSDQRSHNQPSGGGSQVFFHEPDVIASTKLASSKKVDVSNANTTQRDAAVFGTTSQNPSATMPAPVAPPRRKKKGRKTSTSSSEHFNMNIGLSLPPTDTVGYQFAINFCYMLVSVCASRFTLSHSLACTFLTYFPFIFIPLFHTLRHIHFPFRWTSSPCSNLPMTM